MARTQHQHYEAARRQVADGNSLFMEVQRGANPLSPEEIDRLVDLRPERWGRFAGFGAKAQAAKARTVHSM